MTLIDPTADDQSPRQRAPRSQLSPGARVGMVDAMLYSSGGLGTAFLALAEAELGSDFVYEHERRKPEGVHQPARWAKAMAARYRALVIAAGD